MATSGWGRGTWGSAGFGEGIVIDSVVGSVAVTGEAPYLDRGIVPSVGAVTLAGSTPDLVKETVTVPSGTILETGSVPSIVISGNVVTPSVGTLSLVGAVPSVVSGSIITTSVGALSLVGIAPYLDIGIAPAVGSVTVTGIVPQIVQQNNIFKEPITGAINITGIAPQVVQGIIITPAVVGLTLVGGTSTTLIGNVVTPNVGAATLTGIAPSVLTGRVITPAVAVLRIVGGTSTLSNPNWNVINTAQTPGWVQIAA